MNVKFVAIAIFCIALMSPSGSSLAHENCPDFSLLKNEIGKAFSELQEKYSFLKHPDRTEVMTDHEGEYIVSLKEYFRDNEGKVTDCPTNTLVFNQDTLTTTPKPYGLAETALRLAYWAIDEAAKNGTLSYGQQKTEEKHQQLIWTGNLPPETRREIVTFYAFQASRLDRRQISKEEFDYLTAEKDSEIASRERQAQQQQESREPANRAMADQQTSSNKGSFATDQYECRIMAEANRPAPTIATAPTRTPRTTYDTNCTSIGSRTNCQTTTRPGVDFSGFTSTPNPGITMMQQGIAQRAVDRAYDSCMKSRGH